MSISPGARLGAYEILSPLGAGGMGEVWRAKDTRLGREVAIKVLPADVTADPERLRRFEQEARAVSALNHPHIVTLHEVGVSDAGPYLVMEKIEGRSLAELLRAGPLPVKRILAIGAQIAEGLAKAHAAGIVHRDLKPDNVMVTDDGFAKILDFGLAKLVWPDVDGSGQTETAALAGTAPGVILGTLGYLSPEQAAGRPTDFRADQFALGALLYELATAERPFRRDTATASLAAVIHEEPAPVRSKRPELAPQLGWLIERCLAKDPNDRYASTRDLARDLADLRDRLSEISRGELDNAAPSPRRGLRRESVAWIVAAISLAATATLLALRWIQPAALSGPPVRVTIQPPPGAPLSPSAGIALSPDGTKLVFHAGGQLWLRTIAELDPKPLPGTDGALFPFWAPDSRRIGFFVGDRLLRMGIEEASPAFVCDAPSPRGGSWSVHDVILFGTREALRQVPAGGGRVTEASRLEPQHFSHKWPYFLPDGRHFIFSANLLEWKTAPLDLFLGSLDGTPPRRLGESWSGAIYAEPGFVLFVGQPARTLIARRLDLAAGQLAGDSIFISTELALISQRWSAPFSASPAGQLVYVTGRGVPLARPVWTDASGRAVDAAPADYYGEVALSHDGRRAIAAIHYETGTFDLWNLDLERQTPRTRLTDTPDDEQAPIWTRTGEEIFYSARRRGSVVDLFRRRADTGSEERHVRALEGEGYPCDVSLDGKWLLYAEVQPGERFNNLWLLPLDGGDRRAFQIDRYRKNCAQGAISPDGRWVTYASDESGQFEVWVQRLQERAPRYQISKGSAGPARPAWSAGGNEIYYLDHRGRVVAVSVAPGPPPIFGNPRVLIEDGGDPYGFGVARNPLRFLRLLPDPTAPAPTVTYLTRWQPDGAR